jgi:hypothetical protein
VTAIGVVAHKSRTDRAATLVAELGVNVLNVDQGDRVDMPARIDAATDNHVTVLGRLHRMTTTGWVVVLEDDARPVPAFRAQIDAALQSAPSRLVGLYLGTGNPSGAVQRAIQPAVAQAREQGLAWIVGDAFLSAVGYAVHRSVLADLIIAVATGEGELPLRINRWAQAAQIPVAYTCPSLVDHDDDLTSVVYPMPDGQRVPRRAWWCAPRNDWNTRSATLGHCPGWSP